MPGADGATRRAALMRRLRRSQIIVPRLAAAAALVLITAAASTAVVAATPASTVAAHEAGGPFGVPGAPPALLPPEVPPAGDPAAAVPPGAFPTVDGTAPIDGAPADAGALPDYGSGGGDTLPATGDTGTATGGGSYGDVSGTLPTTGGSVGSVAPSGGTGGRVTTPAASPATICKQKLTPTYMEMGSTFHVVSNPPIAPDVASNPTTCVVTSGAEPNPATVLTVVVTDRYTAQDRQRAFSALRPGQPVPNPAAFTTQDGQRHLVWFQQQRMVEVEALGTLRPAPTDDTLFGVARFFTP